ncbi:unnamed protein product [Cylindrotheca closterium]|uniref:Uncharacterized protein n=1 Tax=Cylindrotheca closterium TaxID=2856 RepID=A0AAD2G5C0_9STRA|nr:unnamed protein product [Cylindrotheca closterium]
MKTSIVAFLALAAIQSSKAQDCTEELLLPENSIAFCLVQNLATCGECTNSPGLNLQPGVTFTCAEVEDQICPTVRCCEDCWEVTQKTYQCTVVDSSIPSGLIEEGCVVDCSRFPIGATKPPTPAPVNTGPPPTPPPTMAPVAPTNMDTPTDMPVENTCDEDATLKTFEDCTVARGCANDVTCFQRISQVRFNTSNIDDACAYFEPALCVVDSCCSECNAEYRDALTCGTEASLLDCPNLSCDDANIGGGGQSPEDSSALSLAVSFAISLGLVVAHAVTN